MSPKIVINPKGTRRIKDAHPWVFKSDILGVTDAQPGDVVPVHAKDGQFLGQAFFSPRSQITLRMVTAGREPVDRAFWKTRIERAIQRRESYRKGREAGAACEAGAAREACRLIYGESDFIPSVILDQYGKVLVFQTLSAGADRFRDDFISIFEELLGPEAIIERNDPPVRELEGLVRQKGIVRGGTPVPFFIRRGRSEFAVDPLEGQKTGLFLDQVENYDAAARFARGRVLDLFCYQGGFAIPASATADEVISIDSSGPALALLRENCVRNGLTNVQGVESNGFDYLRGCQDRKETFDTIILDPPPFARDRKNMAGAIRGYKEINLRAMKILSREGILVTCSCSQNFGPDFFVDMLHEAARDAHREIQVLERRGAAPDHPILLTFPESSYLQCWIMRVI